MPYIELAVWIGGWLHFATLTASALVPFVLNWREQLSRVDPLVRQLFWVYGAFIVLSIVAFGWVSVTQADALTQGTPLARIVCGFVAVFWGMRLAVQLFVFDARPYLKHWTLALGYHGLTVVFAYHVVVYSLAAAV